MDIDLSSYPSNSNKSKSAARDGRESIDISTSIVPEEKASYDKIAGHEKPKLKGKVSVKKKGAARIAAETFLKKDLTMVKEHMMDDVIMPNLYITLSDIFHGLIDIIFKDTAAGTRRKKRNGRTEYDKVSWRRDDDDDDRRSSVRRAKKSSGIDLDDIYLESAEDVDTVLDDLRWRIKEYGEASVYDLYDNLGESVDYTKQNWGWTNLDDADAVRVRGGSYLLKLPRPKHLSK